MDVANNKKTTGGITGKGFKPGKSGNPSGRPKVAQEFREKCREFMQDEGWDKLFELARKKGKDQKAAVELIAAYAYGKPKQSIETDGKAELSIKIVGV